MTDAATGAETKDRKREGASSNYEMNRIPAVRANCRNRSV